MAYTTPKNNASKRRGTRTRKFLLRNQNFGGAIYDDVLQRTVFQVMVPTLEYIGSLIAAH